MGGSTLAVMWKKRPSAGVDGSTACARKKAKFVRLFARSHASISGGSK